MTPPPTEPSESPATDPTSSCCPIVELRQYTLHPGQRDVLIDLFDREFIEPQEALGIRVIGQFRDLDRPDYFVWLRGFSDMESRLEALTAFYSGPAWKTHREAANATMIDSDDVLLLHPAPPGSGFPTEVRERLSIDSFESAEGLLVATIYPLEAPAGPELIDFFENTATPVAAECGVQALASFVTEGSPNTYPQLPVREGEQVFVWFAMYRGAAEYAECVAALGRSERWQVEVESGLGRWVKRSPEVFRLAPTGRSRLRG
ncbi:MAG: NIPSNAP family protein [Acidobacteriota bacterium]